MGLFKMLRGKASHHHNHLKSKAEERSLVVDETPPSDEASGWVMPSHDEQHARLTHRVRRVSVAPSRSSSRWWRRARTRWRSSVKVSSETTALCAWLQHSHLPYPNPHISIPNIHPDALDPADISIPIRSPAPHPCIDPGAHRTASAASSTLTTPQVAACSASLRTTSAT
jgi:hypothetical protein